MSVWFKGEEWYVVKKKEVGLIMFCNKKILYLLLVVIELLYG